MKRGNAFKHSDWLMTGGELIWWRSYCDIILLWYYALVPETVMPVIYSVLLIIEEALLLFWLFIIIDIRLFSDEEGVILRYCTPTDLCMIFSIGCITDSEGPINDQCNGQWLAGEDDWTVRKIIEVFIVRTFMAWLLITLQAMYNIGIYYYWTGQCVCGNHWRKKTKMTAMTSILIVDQFSIHYSIASDIIVWW